jgi:hypothetical protein
MYDVEELANAKRELEGHLDIACQENALLKTWREHWQYKYNEEHAERVRLSEELTRLRDAVRGYFDAPSTFDMEDARRELYRVFKLHMYDTGGGENEAND